MERLEQIFEMLGKPARGKKCDAIEGIIDEGKEIMEEYAETGTRRRTSGRRAGRRALRNLPLRHVEGLGRQAQHAACGAAARATLDEEKKTDESLSKLAETAVNYEAAA